MALDSISATNNGMAYKDVVKTTMTPQVKTEEAVKRVSPVSAVSPAATAEVNGVITEGREDEVASRKMKDAIDKVNEKIIPAKTKCEFSYHEDTKRISIKVIDETTEETIREIPSEDILDMLSKIWEVAGLMVDERR